LCFNGSKDLWAIEQNNGAYRLDRRQLLNIWTGLQAFIHRKHDPDLTN